MIYGKKNFFLSLENIYKKYVDPFENNYVFISGGETPKKFMNDFKELDFNWDKVRLSLTDDRMVPHTSIHSNTHVIPQSLKNIFLPLTKTDGSISIGNMKNLQNFHPLISIVGFGLDGHTLSIFDNPALSKEDNYMITQKSDENFTRVSFTIEYIVQSRHIYLLANDYKKLKFIENALEFNIDSPLKKILKLSSEQKNLTVVTGL